MISASKLMDSMDPKLSFLCFNRAFTKINSLLGYPDGAQIQYESYVMFNILYNVVFCIYVWFSIGRHGRKLSSFLV